MNAENRALCFFYRQPPKGSGVQPVKKWAAIARLVWNADGKTHPSANAVKYCAQNWKRVNKKRGNLPHRRTRKSWLASRRPASPNARWQERCTVLGATRQAMDTCCNRPRKTKSIRRDAQEQKKHMARRKKRQIKNRTFLFSGTGVLSSAGK